jgi:hypothetical protein
MYSSSSWRNPTDSAANTLDREKPEVVAPGTDICTTGNPDLLNKVVATSFSTPIVTGGSAVLMQRAPYLKHEPEQLKAIILATARNDVAKDGQLPTDDKQDDDGYGGVDFDWADRLLQSQTSGASFSVADNLDCKTNPSSNPKVIPMNIPSSNQKQPYRVFFVWQVDPSYPDYAKPS